jgi:glycosyltransferase involved in cell wall biosynthesis
MKALVWHWGRRGAGPLFAVRLAAALSELPGCSARLSLAAGAEILAGAEPPACGWREATYESRFGFVMQRLATPFVAGRTRRRLAELPADIAICAMPALLDGRMVAALRAARIPYAVIVHDAAAHPGEALNFRVLDQRRMLRGARWLFALSGHVEAELLRQGFGRNGQSVVKLWHPVIGFGGQVAVRKPSARPRLLYFGRLLPYKGLDLLAGALERLGGARGFDIRICGDGPDSRALERLKMLPGVGVEQRWFADAELPGLLDWADALVLPYREASQSGVAALGIAAGRHVLATKVGGLPEQLAGVAQAVLCEPSVDGVVTGMQALLARLAQPGAAVSPVDSQMDWRAMAAAMRDALAAAAPVNAVDEGRSLTKEAVLL